MYRLPLILALCVLLSAPAFAVDSQVTQISSQDAKAWLDYVVPLPKQVEIASKVLVPRSNIGLSIKVSDQHPAYDQIRKEFADTCGAETNNLGEMPFRIAIQIGGEQAEPLKKLRNSDQAYQITHPQDNQSLTINALTYRGAYHGWKTLQQLIAGKSSADTLTIPIMTATDWPDMERRGLWGTDSTSHLEWLTACKMNHFEQINARGMDEDGKYYAHSKGLPDDFGVQCSRHAADWVPVLLHLEQVYRPDTMDKFIPEVKGKNATHGGALCYSEPKTTEMIAEWIYLLAKQSTSCEVDLWMTENLGGKTGCQCDGCKKDPHPVNEARVVVEAWEMAKKKLGKYITLYALTSEATEAYNKQIFSILPKDIRICYYHSLFTYNTMRHDMLRPYLSDEIKKGRWFGVCPNVDAWTHNNVPFSGASFIKYRMNEFVNKGVQGLLGYATPRVHFNRLNVEAAAEYSWNTNGRTTREFAYSYAVRQGYKDPAKFVEWSEVIGPVGWDIYGSNWPAGQKRGHGVKVDVALRTGTLPELGYAEADTWPTPWGNIKTEKQLQDDVAAAAKAVQLAREMAIPQLMYESLVIDGYIRTLEALYELKKLTPNGGKFAVDNRGQAQAQLKAFALAADQVQQYLPKWERSVSGNRDTEPQLVDKPLGIIKDVTDKLMRAAAEMGLPQD